MSHLVDLLVTVLTALPPGLILMVAFLLPAAEASMFVGLVIPGETAVIVAGVLAHAGMLPLWAVITCAAAGAIVGDQIGFRVGRRYGPALLDRLPRWTRQREQPERVLSMVRRRGVLAVVLGRWTASLRALVPGVAGMSGLPARRFTIANAVGGAVWAAGVALLGYLAGAGYGAVEQQLNLGGGVVLAGLAVIAFITWLVRRHRADQTRHQPSSSRGSLNGEAPHHPMPSKGLSR